MTAAPDYSRLPMPHWGPSVNKLYAELVKRGLAGPTTPVGKFWMIAEQAAGVQIASGENAEAAAAKCLAALGAQ